MTSRDPLTAAEARERVADIVAMQDDDEAAHDREDSLRSAVLEAIVAGCSLDHAVELARIALSTDDLDFERWCA